MPRPFAYGNGRLLAQFDDHHQMRDLCWPLPGQHNHLAGNAIRWGIWLEGHSFQWLGLAPWQGELSSDDHGAVGRIRLTRPGFPIEVEMASSVDPEQDACAVEITLRSLAGGVLHPRLFSHHDLRLYESDMGECAYWDPERHAMVHYKQGVWAAMSLGLPGSPAGREFGASFKGADRLGGAWKGCLQGHLNGNPIDQGVIDSALGCQLDLGIGEAETVRWALGMGDAESVFDALACAEDSPALFARAHAAAAEKASRLTIHWPGLPASAATAAKKTAAGLFSQIAENGAILAANDSDIMTVNRANYSNCWPRDMALTAEACAELGWPEVRTGALAWTAGVQRHKGMLMQKYCPDGSLGPGWHPRWKGGVEVWPIQEDETALMAVVWADEAQAKGQRPEVGGEEWLAALAAYVDADGLPLPSWDLWEERRGVHFFTVLVVIEALRKGAAALALPGAEAPGLAETALAAADKMEAALVKFRLPEGGWARMIGEDGALDLKPDASQLAALLRRPDLLLSEDGKATLARVEAQCAAPGGGFGRYPEDWYHRQGDLPSSPWIICTCWVALVRLALGRVEEAWDAMNWCLSRAAPTGVFAEQHSPADGRPLSVSPLTWSHAEVLTALHRLSLHPAS
jgi:GH15 family glucan-1,4-alpha-glucosidase